MTPRASRSQLGELQRWFLAVSTHPEGARAGATAASGALGLNEDSLEQRVCDGPGLSAVARLQIYNDGYFARLLECLLDDYPCLSDALGEETFAALARDYIAAHTSTSPNLNAYGSGMADFCQGRTEPWARFAKDVAHLEWALVESVHSPSDPPLASDLLASVPAPSWQTARLRANPTLRLLNFEYPVNQYFQAFREGGPRQIPDPGRSATAIYRESLRLWRLDLDPRAASLLEALIAGEPLASAVTALGSKASAEELARLLPQWLSAWVSSGFFTKVEFD